MEKIKEVIVVEGRHDTARLKKYFDCDTIETRGSSLGKDVLKLIEAAKDKRGVIIFTDPDASGNRIRHEINSKIPGCKNAFVDYEHAHTTKKVGVEHADEETLKEALRHLITIDEDDQGKLTMSDLYDCGLCGKDNSSLIREKVGTTLHIGNGTAKTMLVRLNCLKISREELQEVAKI